MTLPGSRSRREVRLVLDPAPNTWSLLPSTPVHGDFRRTYDYQSYCRQVRVPGIGPVRTTGPLSSSSLGPDPRQP